MTAPPPSPPGTNMVSRSEVLDRTVVQVSGNALPITLNISYHVWMTNPGGEGPRTPSPHSQIGLNWIETIGPEAGVNLRFVDDPRSWTLPDFKQQVIQKIKAHVPDIGLVLLAHHDAKDLSWEIVRTGPNVGDPLSSSKIDHPWEWTILSRWITQSDNELKFTVHITGVEPQPTPRRSHMTGPPYPPSDGERLHSWSILQSGITPHPGSHASRTDSIFEFYLQYTIYALLGPTRDGETYYQSFTRDAPGLRQRLDLAGMTFAKLKGTVLVALKSEKRSAAIDALADDADATCNLRWHYSIVDPLSPELRGTFDTSQPNCSDIFTQAVLKSSRHAKVTLVIRMPYEHRVILVSPPPLIHHQLAASTSSINPTDPSQDNTQPLPLTSRRIYLGNKRPKIEDATRLDHLADDESDPAPADTAGERLTMPAFLRLCMIGSTHQPVQDLIKKYEILHWTAFQGQSQETLLALGFAWGPFIPTHQWLSPVRSANSRTDPLKSSLNPSKHRLIEAERDDTHGNRTYYPSRGCVAPSKRNLNQRAPGGLVRTLPVVRQTRLMPCQTVAPSSTIALLPSLDEEDRPPNRRPRRDRGSADELEDPFATPSNSRHEPHGDTPSTSLLDSTTEDRFYAAAAVTPMAQSMATHFLLVSRTVSHPQMRALTVQRHTQLSEEERVAALMSTMIAVNQRLDSLTTGSGISTPPPSAPLSAADQLRTFRYSGVARALIRRIARLCFLTEDLETYVRDDHENSLFRCVMEKIHVLPAAQLREHFPPRFIAGDHSALDNVHTEVQTQLKQVRNKLRNVLLTGIVLGHEPELPKIPCLTDLVWLVWKHLKGKKCNLTPAEVQEQVRFPVRIRIAYLRLQTLFNLLDPDSRNVSQWDQIDNQLIFNRDRPMSYTNSWHRLVCATDIRLFSKSPMFTVLDQSQVTSPTDEQIIAEVAIRAAPPSTAMSTPTAP
ncbi:hypothetical protein PGT21_014434 [Puccinia graminis f. sp. tritici]|uniref:Uncharacterized protein n=1 Tax=Puccinia graminis f. sp. tritici TaxID=56615 RepID=A0A5B0MAA0_PUCGR|nr:hypothetical protein PGT21_014434 [Puccinia graminis f. sp. tritici]